MRHSSNGERGGDGEKRKKKSAEEGPQALPPVAYMGGGGGEWDRAVAEKPGVAYAHKKTNRQIGARDPDVGSEACDVGARACIYVKSCVGRGPQSLDYTRKNRKGRATWDWLKSRSK